MKSHLPPSGGRWTVVDGKLYPDDALPPPRPPVRPATPAAAAPAAGPNRTHGRRGRTHED